MATHQIWFIDEIIRSILAQLPRNGGQRALACCARVSRSLSEPALDALWYKMSGLAPLFRLLPYSFAETKDGTEDKTTFVRRHQYPTSRCIMVVKYLTGVLWYH